MTVKQTVRAAQLGRLTAEERDKALTAFDRATADVPERPRAEVQAELQQLAISRRGVRRRV